MITILLVTFVIDDRVVGAAVSKEKVDRTVKLHLRSSRKVQNNNAD